jgi:hypothetical protein
MTAAIDHPTGDNFYRWRRRVKNHWLQLRLLEGVCADRLAELEAGLEALDGTLAEYNDSRILQRVIGRIRSLSRQDRTRLLVLARRYADDRRRRALHLGTALYGDSAERDAIALLSPGEPSAAAPRPAVVGPWPGAA